MLQAARHVKEPNGESVDFRGTSRMPICLKRRRTFG